MATVKISQETDRARRGLPPRSQQRVSYDTKGRLASDKPSARQHKTEVSHANRKASVTPVARNSATGVRARANAGIRGFDGDASRKSPRRLNLGKFGFSPKGGISSPTGYQHVLMGEMIAAFVIIGIRAIADYTPAGDLSSPGTESPKKGSTPIVLITATLAIYFVLAFLATRGGWAARVSSAFGLLMIIALMINSEAELVNVSTWIQSIGTNTASQVAPTQATSPSVPSGGTPNSGGSTIPLVPSSGPGSPSEPLS